MMAKNNDDIITENNIPHDSEITTNSSETNAFMEELKALFIDNITTVNKKKSLEDVLILD